MVDYILECFEEYKTFMDLKPNLLPIVIPIEKVYPESNTRNPWAYINEDEIGHNTINLYFNSKLSQNLKEFIKAAKKSKLSEILPL